MFVSHPVRSFVPSDVRPTETAWLPATTDWYVDVRPGGRKVLTFTGWTV